MVVHICGPSYLGGKGRRLQFQTNPGKSTRPYLKNKLTWKRTRGMTQWQSTSKDKVLSLITSAEKNILDSQIPYTTDKHKS
jgi:hypothetical protein